MYGLQRDRAIAQLEQRQPISAIAGGPG